jgi:PhnB protein
MKEAIGVAPPSHHRTVIPYLNVRDGWEALEFYKRAFGAEVRTSITRTGGRLAHADGLVAGSHFMLREEDAAFNFRSPDALGETLVNLFVYVDDVATFTTVAVAGGAKVIRPIEEQFHGDLLVELEDPFGHSWFLATHIEDMTAEQLQERAKNVGL